MRRGGGADKRKGNDEEGEGGRKRDSGGGQGLYQMHFTQKLFSNTHGHCVLVYKRITTVFDVTDDSNRPWQLQASVHKTT